MNVFIDQDSKEPDREGGSGRNPFQRIFDRLTSFGSQVSSPVQATVRSLLDPKYQETLSLREYERLAYSLRADGLEAKIGVPLIKVPRVIAEKDFWTFVNDIGCKAYASVMVGPREFAAGVEESRGSRRLNGANYQEGHNDPVAVVAACNIMAQGILDDPEVLAEEMIGAGLHDLAEDMPKGRKPTQKMVLKELKRDPFTTEELEKFYTLIETRSRTDNSLAQAVKLWNFGSDFFVTTDEYKELLREYKEGRADPAKLEALRIAYQAFCYKFMDDGLIIAKFDSRTEAEMYVYNVQLFSPGQSKAQRRKAADVAANSMESALGIECFLDGRIGEFLLKPRETDLSRQEGLKFAVKLFRTAFNRGIENMRFYRENFRQIGESGVMSNELWVTQYYWDRVRLQPALIRAAQYLAFDTDGRGNQILEASRTVADEKYERAVEKAGGPESPRVAKVAPPVYLARQVAEFIRRVPEETGPFVSCIETSEGSGNGRVILALLGSPGVTVDDERFFIKQLNAYEVGVESSGRSNPGLLRDYVLKKNAEYAANRTNSKRGDSSEGELDAAAS